MVSRRPYKMLDNELFVWIRDNRVDVDENGCWNFNGTINTYGYGSLAYNGTTVNVHRLMYRIFSGFIPDGLMVLHGDNCRPCCCNPAHLRLGTNKDNMADKVRLCRTPYAKGESNYNSRLTKDDIKKIFIIRKDKGLTLDEIGKMFGVSNQHISAILNRKSWSHIEINSMYLNGVN